MSRAPGATEEEGKFSNRDIARQEKLDQEISEEASYWETMRGMKLFMGWHQVPEFDSNSSSLDDNPFASTRT